MVSHSGAYARFKSQRLCSPAAWQYHELWVSVRRGLGLHRTKYGKRPACVHGAEGSQGYVRCGLDLYHVSAGDGGHSAFDCRGLKNVFFQNNVFARKKLKEK